MIIDNIDNFIKNKNITKIFLDVDGVLFASCQACAEIINEMQGTDFDGSDVLSWDFTDICPTITSDEVEDMFVSDDFFQRVQWIDGALDFLTKYKKDIVIVTHARTDNLVLKRMFFDQYGLKDIPIIAIPIELHKDIINMKIANGNTLFIDDSTNNLKISNADYCVQFKEYNDNKNRSWQPYWDGDVMYKWR